MSQLLRCSLLFNELEAEVKGIMSRKRQRDEEQRAISKRIALANPLRAPVTPTPAPAPKPTPVAAPAAAPLKIETPAAAPIFRMPMSPKAAAKKAFRKMPAPLSASVLEKCFDEVTPSAAVAIRMGVDCWRRNTLSDEDLISTVRCHVSGSPALAKAFKDGAKATQDEPFEVASSADMAALMKLSYGGIFTA